MNAIWQDAIPVVPVAWRVQLLALPKWPEVGDDVKLTVPVGVAPPDRVSVTVAVHVVAVPALTELGEQDREVVDVARDVVSCPVASMAVHSSADTHAIAFRIEFGSIVVGIGVPGLAGLNVTCCPLLSTAVHRVAVGHATPFTALVSIVVGVGVPGLAGLNVTCCPVTSTAVHWVAVGHATPVRPRPGSIVVGVGVPGLAGLNVTCC
ncbi:MAG: hypothetical protein ACXVHC_07490, partial [Frankiaceae bacterium]